jgi:hypothetical protein
MSRSYCDTRCWIRSHARPVVIHTRPWVNVNVQSVSRLSGHNRSLNYSPGVEVDRFPCLSTESAIGGMSGRPPPGHGTDGAAPGLWLLEPRIKASEIAARAEQVAQAVLISSHREATGAPVGDARAGGLWKIRIVTLPRLRIGSG